MQKYKTRFIKKKSCLIQVKSRIELNEKLTEYAAGFRKLFNKITYTV